MRTKTNSILLLFIVSIMIFATSCRSESDELIQAADNQSLKANSKVANLMFRISLDDTSGDDADNENIECIDFKYPFSASAFNSRTELITSITFENDKDLNQFIEDLNKEDITNINFPIALILFEGTEIITSDLDDLEEIIEDANDKGCDDDDDDDDDNDDDDD